MLANEELIMRRGRIYTFLNPVSYLIALKNEELFERFDGILVDGSFLVAAIKIMYGKVIKRRSFDFTSLAAVLFNHAQSYSKTVYLIGADRSQITCSVGILRKQYPELKIVGYRNGYFSSEDEMREVCRLIVKLAPNYVIAGMGTPLQEMFLLQLKECGYNGIGFTCGGFITQLSMKGIEYYPLWVNRCNLRFLYRFYKEKHTRERYIKAFISFPFFFIRDKLK